MNDMRAWVVVLAIVSAGTAWAAPAIGQEIPQTDVPALIQPAEGAVLDNGRYDQKDRLTWNFRWGAVPAAEAYHLYIVGPKATIALVDRQVAGTQFTKSDISYVADVNRRGWRWRVRAVIDTQPGAWSTYRTFDVEPADTDPPQSFDVPTLIQPAEGAVLDNGRYDQKDRLTWNFRWNAVPGAEAYQLYVIGPKATIPAIDQRVAGTQHTESDTSYVADVNRFGWRWRVRAVINEQPRAWSAYRSFDVEPADTDPPQ